MYYYVYQITNLINNKIYVGRHKSPKHPAINGYYGSGKLIIVAIKKYGKENFTKEVLQFCSSLEESCIKEAEIVTEDFVKRKDTYNLKEGGLVGWDHYYGTETHKANSRKGGLKSANNPNNVFYSKEFHEKNAYNNTPERMKLLGEKANSPSAQRKRKETFKRNKHSQGENNSQYGKVWISNILTKEIRRITNKDTIPEGWVRGKKGHQPKRLWVNNGIKEYYILIKMEPQYIKKGFIKGRIKKNMKFGRIINTAK